MAPFSRNTAIIPCNIWNTTRKLIFSCVLSCASITAQDFMGLRTGMDVNGRYWATLSVEAKATYIVAVQEGMTAVVPYATKGCACVIQAVSSALKAVSGGSSSSFLELAEGVDSFCKEPANRAIPVTKALTYVTKKIKGATSKELDELETSLRRESDR